jgi:tetratricopeptide (TPR) repeat protein
VIVAVLGGAAGYVAYDQHERSRRSRHDDAARAALKDAAFEQGRSAPDAALAAVRRAEAVAAQDEIDGALRREIASLRATLESELAARAAARERDEREQTLLAALERASIEDTDLSNRSAGAVARDAAYEEAFRRFGLEFRDHADTEIVSALRSTRNAVALAAFLDQWALVNRTPETAAETPRLLRIAAAVDPDSDRCRLRDAALARNRGELRRLAAAAHDGAVAPLTLFLLVLALGSDGEAATAIEVARRAVHDHPGDFRLRRDLAYRLAHATPPRSEEALPHAEAAVALEPASISAAVIRIDVLRRLGRLPDALAEAEDLARREPGSYLPWVTLARLQGESGDLEESKRCARTAIGLDPSRPAPHFVLAMGLAHDTDAEPALRECREAARLSERYLPELGQMLHQFGRYDEAVEAFRRALPVDPISAWRGLYDAYTAKNDLGRATDAIRRAVDAAADAPPRDRATLLFELGRALGKSGDTGAAIERWRASLALDPEQPDRLEWLAFKLFYSRRFDEAIDVFRRRKPADAFSGLRDELRQSQDYGRSVGDVAALHEVATGLAALAVRGIVPPADAVAAFRDVFARDPGHVDSRVELARLLTLDPSSELFDPEAALELVDDALERAPDRPAVRHLKGVVLHRLGRDSESVAALRDAIAAANGSPGSVEDWLFLAMAYHELEDRPQSMECFQRIGRDPRPETTLDAAVLSRIEREARSLLGLGESTGSGR